MEKKEKKRGRRKIMKGKTWGERVEMRWEGRDGGERDRGEWGERGEKTQKPI